MSHAYIFWIKDNLGDIIPIRDLKLTNEQIKIKEDIGGFGHVVGCVVKARFGESYFDAKVLKIGSSKELSEAEEILVAAKKRLKSDVQKKRQICPPTRYGHSDDSSGSEDDINVIDKKQNLVEMKEREKIKDDNKNKSFLCIINKYNAAVNNPEDTMVSEKEGEIADNSLEISQDKETSASQIEDLSSCSRAELIGKISELQKKVWDLESTSSGCSKCILQKPPPIVQQYLRTLVDDNNESFSSTEVANSLFSTDRIPLVEGYDLLSTKSQKVRIIVEGRSKPKLMVSKFLGEFFTEEQLGNMSYSGRNENPALPSLYKECLNGLLSKYHPKFLGVAGTVNRICANARYRWKVQTGQPRPGDACKFTPKTKRQWKL